MKKRRDRGWKTGGLFFAVLLSCLSAAPARAQNMPPGASNAGPGGGIWGVMSRYSNAQRVKNRAFARIIQQNDSALALSCFDRALVTSSRLGAIFSDVPAPNTLPPNIALFNQGRGVYNKYAGFPLDNNGDPKALADAYGAVLGAALDIYAGGMGSAAALSALELNPVTAVTTPTVNYSQSISGGMRTSSGGSLALYLLNSVDPFLINMKNAASPSLDDVFDHVAPGTRAAQLLAQINLVLADVVRLQTQGPVFVLTSGVAQLYGDLSAVYTTKVQLFASINSAVDPVTNTPGLTAQLAAGFLGQNGSVTSVLYDDPLLGGMSGVQWSVLSTAGVPPGELTGCNAIAQMWGGLPGNQLSMRGVKEGGPSAIVPYFTYSDLVTESFPAGGPEVRKEINAGANNPIITAARDDLTTYLRGPAGTYANPGPGLSTWPSMPALPPGASIPTIINLVK